MKSKNPIILLFIALGIMFFGAPTESQAVPVTTVTVTVGANTFSGCIGACVNKLWDLTGIDLAPGQSLTLAQTSGFNFNTSDIVCAGGAVGSANCPNPTVSVNGSAALTDATKVLTLNNQAPQNNSFNESINYVSIGTIGSFQLSVAYFDNLHTDACGSGATSLGFTGNPTCTPSPLFFTGGGNTLIGSPDGNAGIVNTLPNHCSTSNCWDTGVIQIRNLGTVPEPASVLFLASGLLGLAGLRVRSRLKV